MHHNATYQSECSSVPVSATSWWCVSVAFPEKVPLAAVQQGGVICAMSSMSPSVCQLQYVRAVLIAKGRLADVPAWMRLVLVLAETAIRDRGVGLSRVRWNE